TAKQISTLPQAELRSMMQTLQLFNYAQQGSNETTERDIVRLLQEQITQMQQSQVQQTEGKQIRTNPIVTLLQELQQNAQQEPVRSSMINLIGQYKALHHQALNMLSEFNLTSTSVLSNEQFSQLQTRMANEIIPLLHPNEQEIVRTLLTTNHAQNVAQLHALLQTFSSNQFYSIILEALIVNNEQSPTHTDLVPERFMLHVNQLLQTLGLSHEAVVKSLPTEQVNLPQS